MTALLQRLWNRAALRGVHFADRHGNLELLYRLQDPWNMAGEREQHRFAETNRILTQAVGKVRSLLEIGCGEGHQSQYLMALTDQLVGLDVSPSAIARARQRLPGAVFEVAGLTQSSAVAQHVARHDRFDLVVAAEVIYYMKDPAAFIADMSASGRSCAVSYFDRYQAELDPLFANMAGIDRHVISHGDTHWIVQCWTPAAAD